MRKSSSVLCVTIIEDGHNISPLIAGPEKNKEYKNIPVYSLKEKMRLYIE